MVLCLPTAVRAQTHDSTIAGWVVSNATLPHDAPASASGIQLIKGIAYYPDANFRDGTIEFDLAPAGTAFTGVAFRMRSAANYEIVYFRPDSGRWARIQYQPVFEGETTWQLYHGDGYEGVVPHASSGPLHVKILVAGSRAQVYVGGLGVAGGSKGDGVNGGISKLTVQFASPRLAMPPRETHPPEQLLRWLVSPRMPSDSIDTPETPPAMIADAGKWKIVDAEGSGLINLTRAVGNSAGPQRVNVFGGAGWGIAYARTRITSPRAQTRRLYLSYSDGIGVYVNGARVFSGVNAADSRGKGYLGIVGPETEYVDLALRAGDNDVLLAITDKAFGWGFRARLDSLDGVSVKLPR